MIPCFLGKKGILQLHRIQFLIINKLFIYLFFYKLFCSNNYFLMILAIKEFIFKNRMRPSCREKTLDEQ